MKEVNSKNKNVSINDYNKDSNIAKCYESQPLCLTSAEDLEKSKKGSHHAKHKYLEIKEGKYVYDHSKMTAKDHEEAAKHHDEAAKKEKTDYEENLKKPHVQESLKDASEEEKLEGLNDSIEHRKYHRNLSAEHRELASKKSSNKKNEEGINDTVEKKFSDEVTGKKRGLNEEPETHDDDAVYGDDDKPEEKKPADKKQKISKTSVEEDARDARRNFSDDDVKEHLDSMSGKGVAEVHKSLQKKFGMTEQSAKHYVKKYLGHLDSQKLSKEDQKIKKETDKLKKGEELVQRNEYHPGKDKKPKANPDLKEDEEGVIDVTGNKSEKIPKPPKEKTNSKITKSEAFDILGVDNVVETLEKGRGPSKRHKYIGKEGDKYIYDKDQKDQAKKDLQRPKDKGGKEVKKRDDGTFEVEGSHEGSKYYSKPGESMQEFLTRVEKEEKDFGKKDTEQSKLEKPEIEEYKKSFGKNFGPVYVVDKFISIYNRTKNSQRAFEEACEDENYHGNRKDVVADRKQIRNFIKEKFNLDVDHDYEKKYDEDDDDIDPAGGRGLHSHE